MLKRTLTIIGALLLGTVAAEIYLRTVIPEEAALELGFTPGVHQKDTEFAFVYSPGYEGTMRYQDGVWGVPIKLDEHGFRVTGGPVEVERNVVFIGGKSMMFCYGLPDNKTVTEVASRHTSTTTRILNTAWPATDVHRNWQVFRGKVGDSEHFDLAVIGIYISQANVLNEFAKLPDDLDTLPDTPARKNLLGYVDGVVVPSGGYLKERIGRVYYASYVGYHLFDILDRIINRVLRYTRPHDSQRKLANPEAGREGFPRLMSHYAQYFRARNTKVIVVFIPSERRLDLYDELVSEMPTDIEYTNLHRELHGKLDSHDNIALGHWGRENAARIGRALARVIDTALDAEAASGTD